MRPVRVGGLAVGILLATVLVGCASSSAAEPTPDIGATVTAYVQAHRDDLRGPQGSQGVAGQQGPEGDKGDPGAAGIQGAKGDAGATGATGLPGRDSLSGSVGAAGPSGPQGIPGPSGPQGASGKNARTYVGDCSVGFGFDRVVRTPCFSLVVERPSELNIMSVGSASAATSSGGSMSISLENEDGKIYVGGFNYSSYDWSTTTATFTGSVLLSPGKYTFYMKGENRGNAGGYRNVSVLAALNDL